MVPYVMFTSKFWDWSSVAIHEGSYPHKLVESFVSPYNASSSYLMFKYD